jgi:beta-lactamase class A
MVEQKTDRLAFRRYPAAPRQDPRWVLAMPELTPTPLRQRPPRAPRTNRGLLFGAIAIVAVIIAAIALSWAASRASKAPSRPVGSSVAGARIGAEVLDLSSGTTLLDTSGDVKFRADSLVKLLIAADLVDRGYAGGSKASPRVTRMLSYSDDQIADQLWQSGGRTAIIAREVAKLGLTDTEPPADPGRWGDTTTTASDVVRIYQHILSLAAPDRDYLLKALRNAPEVSADGFDQHYGIASGLSGWPWAIKQGWASGRGSVEAHTTGLVGKGDRYLVVLLAGYPDGTDLATAAKATSDSAATLAPLLAKDAAR